MNTINVEIWSDVVCPWCYIGKRRFESALARFEHRDQVDVLWRSFELDTRAPRQFEGTADERLAKKYGIGIAQAAALHDRVTAQAAQEGLEYHFDIAQYGNTFDAHRLIHFAADHGLQDAMKERLLRAYFTEGESISSIDALAKLAGEVGLDIEAARAALEGGLFSGEVRADEEEAVKLGITGVPFFAVNRQYGISGAQPPKMFLDTLEKAWSDSNAG